MRNKCRIRCGLDILDTKTILKILNNPEFLLGEGYHDPLRGKYTPVMEYEYDEVRYGDTICPVYYLIKDGIKSCQWSKSAFDSKFEILNKNKYENKT